MKTGAIISVVLLGVILLGGWYLTGLATDAAAQAVSAANELDALSDMNDWQRAEAACSEYAAQWKKSRDFLTYVLPDDILDAITEAYEQIGTGIRFEDAKMCAEACVSLRRAAEDLYNNEQLTAENLL